MTPIAPAEARTLYGLFCRRAEQTPDRVAYRYHDDNSKEWRALTWAQTADRVAAFQGALKNEGLNPGDRVGIALRNGPDWVVCEQAALGLGLVVVPLYVDDRAESMAYVLDHAAVKLLFMIDQTHYDRLRPALNDFGTLQKIVLLRGEHADAISTSLKRWLPETTPPLAPVTGQSGDLATLVYTSGTLGRPKGVCLSHANILHNAHAPLSLFSFTPDDCFLSFLPLSHMLERTAGHYLPMTVGCTVAYARSVQLLADDLKTVQPTVLIAVPRIFEKVYARLKERIETGPALKRMLFNQTLQTGWRRFEAEQNNTRPAAADRLAWPLLDKLVAAKIRQALGGRLRLAVSGGAALGYEVGRLFLALEVTLLQGYGLTEASPVISVNLPQNNDPKSVGVLLPGIEARLGDRDELLVKSPCVMMGYHRNEAATREAIDADGWLHTGDQARLNGGRIYLTGRIKEILVLSNGEKVPPADIENSLKLDPLMEEVVIFGEGQPFIGAVIRLNRELFEAAARKLGLAADPSDKLFNRWLVRHCNDRLHGFPAYAKLRRTVAITDEWSIENGLLTPTLKVKRNEVLKRYEEKIKEVYEA